ncbi:MAG: GHKL domain-containing protein [Lachnospiraceae bacterium]|nr:GHKL domain-containing protein [Lachnospiraceae bacterium]
MNFGDVIFLSAPLETFPWVVQQMTAVIAYMILGWKSRTADGERKRPAKLIAEGFCLLAVFLLCSIFMITWMAGTFIFGWILFQAAVLAVYLHKCTAYRMTTKIIMWCSMYAGMQALASVSGQVSYLVGAYLSTGVAEMASRCLINLLLIALACYLVKFNFDEFDGFSFRGLVLIIACDVCLLLLSISETALWINGGAELSKCYLVSYFCMFVLLLFSISALYSICKEQEAAEILRQRQQQLLNEQERFHMAEQQIEEIRSIRHDLKNQRHYMQILLEEGRYEELKHYFANSGESMPNPEPYVKCGNKSVNVILNMEFAKVGPEIKLEHLLVVPPVLPFQDDELCSLLTNLLDNAVEGCAQAKRNGEQHLEIQLEMYPQSNFLYIFCKNTTHMKKLNHWRSGVRSTKEDKTYHGFGTQIVSRIAEKYNGCAEYKIENGSFVAKVLMEMRGEDDQSSVM